MFREMNYLKYLACRIRDRIDPDSPAPGDLDEIERLQAEALKLKYQIVETHLRLVVAVAKKHVRAGYDLPERVSDGTFALLIEPWIGSTSPEATDEHLCHLCGL